ncbi:MAG: DEAD/DEAH box helicase family protein, partial [Myxococcales bacterium]|nr:DEAD/DEAH box helicase family protein [Myxococcales bacterium]
QPEAGRALAEDFESSRAQRRRELLRIAVEHPEGLPRQTLLRLAESASDSPLKTLLKAGLVRLEMREDESDVFRDLDLDYGDAPPLMPDQHRAAATIGSALESGRHRGFLLHGVTGSGKTEVYLDAIRRCLDLGRAAIVMVPEISLTPQTIERFESRFGSVAVLHSHLTDAERARQWQLLRSGQRRIAIGPRSAVFAPVGKLGLIILDEEHENTFKQQNTPR